jgi:hypothetical protein
MVNFDTSKAEYKTIHAIALRAIGVAHAAGIDYPLMDAEMDLSATHCNGMPLDLDKLASFDEFNFAHDIFGIRRHLDRETGALQNCFVPRCAAPRRKLT